VTIKFMENGTEVKRTDRGEVKPIDNSPAPESDTAAEPKTILLNQGVEAPRFAPGPAPARPAPALEPTPYDPATLGDRGPDQRSWLLDPRCLPAGLAVRVGPGQLPGLGLSISAVLPLAEVTSTAAAPAADRVAALAGVVRRTAAAAPQAKAADEARAAVAEAEAQLRTDDRALDALRVEYQTLLDADRNPAELAGRIAAAETARRGTLDWLGRRRARLAEAAAALHTVTLGLWREAAADRGRELARRRAELRERVERELRAVATELLGIDAEERRLSAGEMPAPAPVPIEDELLERAAAGG
jgi:hypothetical protein